MCSRKSNRFSQRTNESLRTKEVAFGIYRCLQYLSAEFNGCYASFAMPVLQLCLLIMDVIPLFMTVRFHAQLPLLTFIAIPLRATTTLLLTSYLFPVLGNMNQLSLKFTRSWKSTKVHRNKKQDTCFLKSCAPLKVKSGSLFFMRKFTVFKLFGLILYYTMKLLLIF